MPQIIQERGLGETLGSALGTGLGSGIQALAQNKLQQMQQQKVIPGLQALGFAPEQAQQLAGLPESSLSQVIKQKLIAPQQQAYAQALSELLGQPQAQQEQQIQQIPQIPLSPAQQQIGQPGIKLPTGLTEQQATQLANIGLKKQKEAREEKRAAQQEKAEAFKATKEIRNEITNKARSATTSLHELDRLEELEKEGKLDTPGYVEFLKRSGFDIPSLMSPGSEEFNKIAASFIRDAKANFGARVSNYELEQFLKTIPNLSLSPEGRKRVIANLKYINRASKEYFDTMKEIVRENKGIPPFDLNEQIEDRIGNKLDKVAQKFREDLTKPVPEAQNRLVTATQAALGSLVGLPGTVLKGLAKVPEVIGLL